MIDPRLIAELHDASLDVTPEDALTVVLDRLHAWRLVVILHVGSGVLVPLCRLSGGAPCQSTSWMRGSNSCTGG